MPVLALIILGMLSVGAIMATLIERLRWNELVQRGILPRPTGQSHSKKV